ncbi:MAG: DUF2169 domain-containing protein [Polyangiaceae bacterium]
MAGSPPEPSVSSLPGTAARAVLWMYRGRLHITVVAKATFGLAHDKAMQRIAPQPLIASDIHHGKLPNRSIRHASDLAPRVDQVDVVFTGHAHVPGGTLPRLTVRLAVLRDGQPIVDKRILVQDPAGFSKMPIMYEQAAGGIGKVDNPLGTATPTLLDPSDPSVPAAFGPFGRSWPTRRRLLGSTPRRALEGPIAEIPDDFDFSYFQTTPADQRIDHLRGDEWLLLEGLHPSLPVVRAGLPRARALARIHGLGAFGVAEGTVLPLRADTLRIDGDEQWCTLTYRRSFEVPSQEAIAAARIVATVEVEGEERTASIPSPTLMATAILEPKGRTLIEGTLELSDADLVEDDIEITDEPSLSEDAATLIRADRTPRDRPPAHKITLTVALDADTAPPEPNLPFEPAAPDRAADAGPPVLTGLPFQPEPDDAPPPTTATPPLLDPSAPEAPAPEQPPSPPAPRAAQSPPAIAEPLAPPIAAPIAPPIALSPEEPSMPLPGADDDATITLSEAAERSARAEKPLPFEPSAKASLPPPAAPEDRPQRPRAASSTYVLEAEEQVSAAEKSILPFISSGAKTPAAGGRANEHIPARTSDAIPIFTKTRFVACTFPWQIRPGQEIRTLVVKSTFDLVADGPARQRDESDPPCGDIHEGDDPARDVRYPSDLAVFKPKADVTLRGHAHAPGGRSGAAEVSFRFGRDRRGFERRIAVFGDRFWSRAKAMSEPLPFERIPLLHEHAYGGADFALNPLGKGRSPGPDGRVPLPNLEDRGDLVKAPTSTPRPACVAPIPWFFRERTSRLGTYGPEWTKERWPYFPDDFDFAHFQHAPVEQRLDALTGDEPYELVGVFKDTPRLRGRLPGLAPRAFAQKTTAAGGLFFEVVLRLDSVVFDADARKVDLVWRGLVDVADDEASDIAEIYILAASTSGAPIDLARARARYRAEKGPWPVLPAEPSLPVANASQSGAAVDPHAERVAAKLRAAGVPRASSGQPTSGAPRMPFSAAGASDTAAIAAQATASAAAAAGALGPEDEVPRPPRDDAALRATVRDRLAQGIPLDGLDLTGADLSGIDFSSRSLSFLVFKEARLAGCRFAGADLTGAVLSGADLTDAVLERALLTGADLTGARLDHANLDEAELSAADLSLAYAESATLRKATGTSARFVGTLLSRAHFEGARLPSADFTRATLDAAVLDDLHAPELRLYDARASRASFKRADLSEARADGACLTDCSLALAKAASSVWDGAVLDGSTFLGATLTGAGFAKASCDRAVLSGADLADARLPRARLKSAQLVRANLLRASLEAADLTGADLRSANLHGADTWKARLRGAKLDLAIVTGTKLAKEKA